MNTGIGYRQRCMVWFVFTLVLLTWVGILILAHFEVNTFRVIIFPYKTTKKVNTTKKQPGLGAADYFKNADRLQSLPLLINTTGCRIPALSEWDEELSSKIHKPKINASNSLSCISGNSTRYSSIEGSVLVLHDERMVSHCCIRTIKREEMSMTKYTMNADNLIAISSCSKLTQTRTRIPSEFIQIQCTNLETPVGNLVASKSKSTYSNIHASAFGQNLSETRLSTQTKLQYWSHRNSQVKGEDFPIPPNILIIGQDSTSRLNFKRYMGKTRRVLESLGAVEMAGFAKVADNTLPNFAALLSGYSLDNLRRLCLPNHTTAVDGCPLIWSRFDQAQYLTAFAEDSPQIAIFNYKRPGFVHQPVNFYLRPAFLGAKKTRDIKDTCIGNSSNDEFILNYMESALELSHEKGVPLFGTSWSTLQYHEDPAALHEVDKTYADFLLRLQKKELLNNTILFMMGDHGYRYGSSRNTLPGYFENKLPNLWVLMSEDLVRKYPHWKQALHFNSKGLTSAYTLYWTMNLVLDTFSEVSPLQPASMIAQGADNQTSQVIHREHKRFNLFHKIPRTAICNEFGVIDEFCPCWGLRSVSKEDKPVLNELMHNSILWINSNVINGTRCKPLKASQIYAGAVADAAEGLRESFKRYIVSFTTSPGRFRVEAEMNYSPANKSFYGRVSINRVNSISGSDLSCIKQPVVENFCAC